MNIINNDLTATVGTASVPFEFIYDSTTGKYGYKDGADTFHPFNDASGGGGSQSLGTGRSFNLKTLGISDYASLTVDNFVCEISTASLSNANATGYAWSSGESYNDSRYTKVTKSYNASTGVLTLTGGTLSNNAGKYNGQGGQTKSASCTITTWIIR